MEETDRKPRSFEQFLIERLKVDRGSRTSKGNLCFEQARVYDEMAQEYEFLDPTGTILRDLRDHMKGRGSASAIEYILGFLEGGEDFAFRGLPESTRSFDTEDLYELCREYLSQTGMGFTLDKEHRVMDSEGRISGYCTITKVNDIILVTLRPYAFQD